MRTRVLWEQVQSKEEEEQVNILEFRARQRLTALEAETAQAAMLSKMRDEVRLQCVVLCCMRSLGCPFKGREQGNLAFAFAGRLGLWLEATDPPSVWCQGLDAVRAY